MIILSEPLLPISVLSSCILPRFTSKPASLFRVSCVPSPMPPLRLSISRSAPVLLMLISCEMVLCTVMVSRPAPPSTVPLRVCILILSAASLPLRLASTPIADISTVKPPPTTISAPEPMTLLRTTPPSIMLVRFSISRAAPLFLMVTVLGVFMLWLRFMVSTPPRVSMIPPLTCSSSSKRSFLLPPMSSPELMPPITVILLALSA